MAEWFYDNSAALFFAPEPRQNYLPVRPNTRQAVNQGCNLERDQSAMQIKLCLSNKIQYKKLNI